MTNLIAAILGIALLGAATYAAALGQLHDDEDHPSDSCEQAQS